MSRLTASQLDEITARQGYAVAASVGGGPSAPVVELAPGNEPLAPTQAETGNTGVYLVRVVSFRRRLLDEDNLCEKYHVDALRYAALLPDDSPARCRIVTSQEKVRSKDEERTEITIQQAP